MVSTIVSLLATAAFLTLPIVMIWGWVRWIRRKKLVTVFSVLSLIGLALSTASELLAISMVVYAKVKGGFGYYDPSLMRIYAWGILLSLGGLALAAIGVWRQSSLRWHALICSIGALCTGLCRREMNDGTGQSETMRKIVARNPQNA
jgi:hypothetical protein